MRRMEGKLAVITGAGSGIGRASALRFASEGARLAILDLDGVGLEQTAESARAAGTEVLTITADCTDQAAVVDAFKKISADAGFVDILMNNVGQSARERASEFYKSDPEVWRFVIEVSLMATLTASRQVVPAMREAGRGKIVNVASNAGMAGEIGISEYAAAKMGVIGFTRSLARELAPFKVNVNAVCPRRRPRPRSSTASRTSSWPRSATPSLWDISRNPKTSRRRPRSWQATIPAT